MSHRPKIRGVGAALCFAVLSTALCGAAAAQQPQRIRIVKQDPGGIVYWVLPGPRDLDPAVFGTHEDPRMLLAPKIEAARQGPYPPSVAQLLTDLPFLVGLPLQVRDEGPDGGQVLQSPNPFSDRARIVSGSFEAEFRDFVSEDQPGAPGETPDSASMTAEFEDPAGNAYRVVLDHIVQPPFPGYETEGGVMIDSVHHGATGTGTPLMPAVETHAALWSIAEIFVNGESRGMRVAHLMTTEIVRDSDYRLVFGDELPLAPEDRQIAEQAHHTHLMVLPIEPGPRGPAFAPVPTALELPNGTAQPFMHIMFEQDEIVE